MNRTLRAATRTKQFNQLISAGLQLASTERQLKNGTIKLTGTFRQGRKTITPEYTVTATGNITSNGFRARQVAADGTTSMYRTAFEQVQELLSKRITTV